MRFWLKCNEVARLRCRSYRWLFRCSGGVLGHDACSCLAPFKNSLWGCCLSRERNSRVVRIAIVPMDCGPPDIGPPPYRMDWGPHNNHKWTVRLTTKFSRNNTPTVVRPTAMFFHGWSFQIGKVIPFPNRQSDTKFCTSTTVLLLYPV